MKIAEVKKLSTMERMLYWIQERHQIHLRRQSRQSKPWTDDEVMQSYFFTNPYRENDKTTVWFREKIREPLRNNPSVLMATIIFRWFNYIPTGELLLENDLLEQWDSKRASSVLQSFANRHGKVFTGAYVVNARHGKRDAPHRTKIDVVCERIDAVWIDRKALLRDAKRWSMLEQAQRRLQVYSGLDGGGFAAYEIVSDLRHTYLLDHASDINTWCNPGAGAVRGMNRLLQRPQNPRVTDWDVQSQKILGYMQQHLHGMPQFEMREVEHSLCEFFKYEKALFGLGRLKRRYKGK